VVKKSAVRKSHRINAISHPRVHTFNFAKIDVSCFFVVNEGPTFRLLQRQVEMVPHDHVGVEALLRADAGFEQAAPERVAGLPAAERSDAAVAPVDDMVTVPGKLESQFARHREKGTARERSREVID